MCVGDIGKPSKKWLLFGSELKKASIRRCSITSSAFEGIHWDMPRPGTADILSYLPGASNGDADLCLHNNLLLLVLHYMGENEGNLTSITSLNSASRFLSWFSNIHAAARSAL